MPCLRLFLPLLLLVGCEATLLGPDADRSPRGILRTLWTDLDRHYALFRAKAVDWDAVGAECLPTVDESSTSEELWTAATDMLGRLGDPHVQMNTPDGSVFFNGGPKRDQAAERFSILVVKRDYLRDSYQVLGNDVLGNARLLYGILPGSDIAYLWLATFAGDPPYADAFDTIVTDANTRAGLVVDLRANVGGNTRNMLDAIASFVEHDLTYLRWRERNGPAHDDFAPLADLTVRRSPGRPFFRGPLAVLVDEFTGSSADHFHFALKEFAPNATTFGERTSGNFGSIENYKALANGWRYTYSAREAVSLAGLPLDSLDGMPPDVEILGSQEELLRGHDRVLDAAVAHLLGR